MWCDPWKRLFTPVIWIRVIAASIAVRSRAIALFAILGLLAAPAVHAAPESVGDVAIGENVFWKGGYAETAGECDPDDPDQECPTFEYELTTAGGASRLRIGFDLVLDYRSDGTIHPDADGGRRFQIEVFDKEDGNRRFTVPADGLGQGYSIETFLCFGEKTEGDHRDVFRQGGCPEGVPFTLGGTECQEAQNCVLATPHLKHLGGSSAGTWGIRVTARNSSGWSFRMRARLEGTPRDLSEEALEEELLPNLRPIPPFELSFLEPLISGGFVGRDPVEGNGCTPDEEASYPELNLALGRCLRFSTGPENVGAGDFEVRKNRDDAPVGPNEFPAHQRIYRANGDPARDLPAGTLVFDQHHGHWHYKDWLRYELFEVAADPPTDPPHSLAQFSPGRKAGFCPSDERLADWPRFFQDWRGQWIRERNTEQANEGDLGEGALLALICQSPDEPMMGLDAGWGDEYEWGRVDQFVPFPTNGLGTGPKPGSYVLRATTDADGHVLESDETDNVSFVYFTVDERGKITIKQRGYGADPWGPKKVE